jgi:hypothetical protein
VRAGSFALLTFVVLACAGCGANRGLVGSIYRDREATYRIGTVGEGWSGLDVEGEGDLAWHDDDVGAVIAVNASCDPGADVPLTALTNHLLAGFTQREIVSEELVPLDGREALRTHVRARLDGVQRELLFYVLKKNECVYDFGLVTPVGSEFEEALVEFEPFVAGFSTEVRDSERR